MADAAGAQVASQVQSLPATATGPQVLQVLQPYIAAAQKYQHEVGAMHFPPKIASDAHALVTQVGALAAVMQGISQNNFTIGSWATQFESASTATKASAQKLRQHLGLPAAS